MPHFHEAFYMYNKIIPFQSINFRLNFSISPSKLVFQLYRLLLVIVAATAPLFVFNSHLFSNIMSHSYTFHIQAILVQPLPNILLETLKYMRQL
jgi:hypothetical protein